MGLATFMPFLEQISLSWSCRECIEFLGGDSSVACVKRKERGKGERKGRGSCAKSEYDLSHVVIVWPWKIELGVIQKLLEARGAMEGRMEWVKLGRKTGAGREEWRKPSFSLFRGAAGWIGHVGCHGLLLAKRSHAVAEWMISRRRKSCCSPVKTGSFDLMVSSSSLAVHGIRDLFWDGIPAPGAAWLREQSLEQNWQRIIFVPACGGVVVGLLNTLRSTLESSSEGIHLSDVKASFRSFLKTVAASVTLGTGNSLGPEGPSVEIGASIANGLGKVLQSSQERKISLVATGSAAGISSGFNAPLAGCFFAVESVLWPSSADMSPSLSNTTSMVILSAVIASVISQAGLGSDPAFKIPTYEFRSPAELPLYLLLGILCGLVSVALSKSTTYAMAASDAMMKYTGVPAALLPPLGGLSVGLIALAYPEVLYWGFENVDILLESRPFVKGPPADLLLQLVGVKIIATSLSRASGLVGGYYAPSLFIGAALGSAYGKITSYAVTHADPVFHLDALEVASPQAYALDDTLSDKRVTKIPDPLNPSPSNSFSKKKGGVTGREQHYFKPFSETASYIFIMLITVIRNEISLDKSYLCPSSYIEMGYVLKHFLPMFK
eukprot:Gb_04135 [translate_table: standard]